MTDPAPQQRIAELEALIGLAILHIDGRGHWFSQRNKTAVLDQLRRAVPDAEATYWTVRKRRLSKVGT